MTTNWAGNYAYRAARILRPASVPELQRAVAAATRVRALGTGHSFNALPDSAGDLVRLDALPPVLDVDSTARTVTIGGGMRYGEVADRLHRAGWALSNLASLPHISVAGAVATASHGSGDGNQTLAASVRALEVVGPDGELRTVQRGDPDFDGWVVALGALGVVTRLVLDVRPTFEVVGSQFTGLGWDAVDAHFEELMGSGYSVSLFTRWTGGIEQVWVKDAAGRPRDDLFGAARSDETLHMLSGASPEAVTEQRVPGPWHERLPHFRMAFTPSRGEELQTEYFVPRNQARAAFEAMRGLADRLAPLLQVSEVRTVAADTQWLSGSCERDSVGVHFTWVRDEPGVYAVLPAIERALLPLGARPHWGKCFTIGPADVRAAFPRLPEFAALRARVDPGGKFLNGMVGPLVGAPTAADAS